MLFFFKQYIISGAAWDYFKNPLKLFKTANEIFLKKKNQWTLFNITENVSAS